MPRLTATLAGMGMALASALSAPAEAARIDVEALGLVATPYLGASALTFFGDATAANVIGTADDDPLINIGGSAAFATAVFTLTLDILGDPLDLSSLTATGTQLGLADDGSVLDILFEVTDATGGFAALNGAQLLATIDDPLLVIAALADPFGGFLSPGSATLATLAPASAIPLPPTLPLTAAGIVFLALAARRRRKRTGPDPYGVL